MMTPKYCFFAICNTTCYNKCYSCITIITLFYNKIFLKEKSLYFSTFNIAFFLLFERGALHFHFVLSPTI